MIRLFKPFRLPLALLLLATALPAAGQAPAADSEASLWVEARDAQDRPVGALSPGELAVTVLGEERAVASIDSWATAGLPWRQLIYFDLHLSDRLTIRRAADAFAARAAEMVALGPVEVVTADPRPRLLLAATRDDALLAQTLARLALEARAGNEIRRLRDALLEGDAALAGLVDESRRREAALRTEQNDRLVAWLANRPGAAGAPSALWLVSGARELPFAPFYEALTPGWSAANSSPGDELARFLAASGWTVFTTAIAGTEEEAVADSQFDQWREDAGAVDRADTVDLLALLRRGRERAAERREQAGGDEAADSAAAAAERRALETLATASSAETMNAFARQTGGRAVVDAERLAAEVAALGRRFRVTLRTEPAAAETRLGEAQAVAWRATAPDTRLLGPAWLAAGSPEELGAARVRRLLAEGLDVGRLATLAELRLEVPASGTGLTAIGNLNARIDLAPLTPAERAALEEAGVRLTVGAELADGSLALRQVEVPPGEPSSGDIWSKTVSVDLPLDVERAAVVVEGLAAPIALHGGDLAALSLPGAATPETTASAEESDVLAPATDPEPRSDSITRTGGDRFADSVDVRLAELYVTVTADGSPVRGLKREEFTLKRNGVVQPIDSVVDAIDLPVTLGLAIDSSSSMFFKLPAVTDAARHLVRSLTPQRDQAFLVSFGPQPRLVEATTQDLSRVGRSTRDLEADGGTPLWSAVLLSLEQLTEVEGKKALVVFLDGADDDGNARYRECLDKAQANNVPIYLIVMNNEAARTDGKDFRTRSFTSRLDRLAAAGGGRVFYLPIDADLEPVYQKIESELRSYYLLTYYPTAEASAGSKIDVEVARKGTSVRTLAGYGPGE